MSSSGLKTLEELALRGSIMVMLPVEDRTERAKQREIYLNTTRDLQGAFAHNDLTPYGTAMTQRALAKIFKDAAPGFSDVAEAVREIVAERTPTPRPTRAAETTLMLRICSVIDAEAARFCSDPLWRSWIGFAGYCASCVHGPADAPLPWEKLGPKEVSMPLAHVPSVAAAQAGGAR